MDRWLMCSPSTQAVSMRRSFVKGKISEAVAEARALGKACKIMAVASGPATEVAEWLQVC